MDSWQAVQNWIVFGVVLGGAAWYYYPTGKKVEKAQEKVKARDQAPAPKQPKQHHAKRGEKSDVKVAFAPVTTPSFDTGKDTNDDNALNFAEQMMKARKGTTLKNADKNDTRVKTVKQGSALRTPAAPTKPAQVAAEDDPVPAPSATTTGVDDMLEPVAPGPSSLRIAPSQQPVKEKTPKPAKQETVETKKQRQNRQKTEAKKQQREEEERERKALEEKQRRSAREARGEPARNGIPVSKPPANNAWSDSNGTTKLASEGAVTNHHSTLLDTFDAESTSSSNAGVSTAATSTTEAHRSHWTKDLPTEEEQIAAFQAEDDGWNEVKSSKKQKKKTGADSDGASTPVPAPVANTKPAAPAAKVLSNGKPIGFQALNDELEQSTDVDPDDLSNWVA